MPIIDINQKITSRLPIEPVLLADKVNYKFDGLCPAILQSVEIREQTDSKGEFADIPRKVLDFTFINYKGANTSEPDRFTTMSERAIGSKMEEGGVLVLRNEADILKNNNDMFKRIKHILDNCYASPNFRGIDKLDAKTLAKYFDLPGLIEGEDEAAKAAARIAKYDLFLQFMCDWFNGTEADKKPCIYKNAKGELIIQGWLKVLPAYPKYVWYSIPSWVQTGFFEYAGIDPSTKALLPAKLIKVKPSENLTLSSGKKQPHIEGGGIDAGMPEGLTPAMAAYLKSQSAG